jgi:flagellar export protein FliJ
MSHFNFRLQKVLDLKERHAQAAAAQLTTAQLRADEARDACLALAAIRQAGGAQLAAAHRGTATAGQIQNSSYLLEKLDQHVDQATEVVDAALSGVANAQAEFTLANQAKRVLDRLRERQFGDWQHTLMHSDRQQMDAFALSVFTRHNPHFSDET